MPLVETRVDASFNFDRIDDAVHAQAKRAVEVAARVGAAEAARVASQRRKSGRMAQVTPDNAIRTVDGWRASFVSPVPWAWWQNYGTLKGRRRRLSAATIARRSSGSGQKRLAKVSGSPGIEPLHFLEAGRRAGLAALKQVLARGL